MEKKMNTNEREIVKIAKEIKAKIDGNIANPTEIHKIGIIKGLKTTGQLKNIPDEQAVLFLNYCLATNLNPIIGEVYIVRFGANYSPMVSYTTYIKKAEDELDGYRVKLHTRDKDGKELPRDQGYSITTLKRKGSDYEFSFELDFKEVMNDKNPLGKTKPKLMFDKVSIVNAIRKACPSSTNYLPYAAEEDGVSERDRNEHIVKVVEEKYREVAEIEEGSDVLSTGN